MFLALFLMTHAVMGESKLVDVRAVEPRFVLDLRYATTDNFTHQQLYPVARCLLHTTVLDKLLVAQKWLDQYAPGCVLMLKDCYRPLSVQRSMWEVVKGTPMASYVANPNGKLGSVHNYGAAVDVTVMKDNVEMDMGTPYDFLGPRAEPRNEKRLLAEGELTARQIENRQILRRAMTQGGFRSIPNEWWHFDAVSRAELLRSYEKLDVPLDALP